MFNGGEKKRCYITITRESWEGTNSKEDSQYFKGSIGKRALENRHAGSTTERSTGYVTTAGTDFLWMLISS